MTRLVCGLAVFIVPLPRCGLATSSERDALSCVSARLNRGLLGWLPLPLRLALALLVTSSNENAHSHCVF